MLIPREILEWLEYQLASFSANSAAYAEWRTVKR